MKLTPADSMSSRLFIPLRDVDPNAEYVVTARLRPFVLPQSVDIRINGQLLMVQPLIDDWQEITWAIPKAGDQTDASAGRRGVNVTVLDGAGETVEMVGFDTAANEFESEKLAEFLRKVGPNRPILIASSGDASAFLTDAAIEALRGIGADLSLDGLRGNSFAIVGVQGAAAGSAAVAVDPNEAFLRISLNRDRRPLAAAVDWVKVEP